MKRKRMFLIGLVVGGFVLLLATPSMAVHKGAGELTCGSCHTMHNSQGWNEPTSQLNAGGPADGSIVLLRGNVSTRAEIHNLCLQCHAEDGSQAATLQAPHGKTAPKVYRTTAWDGSGFDDIGAGGDFSSTMTWDGAGNAYVIATAGDGGPTCASPPSLGKGHSLGCTAVTPPGAQEGSIDEFTCTNCHDPHGAQWDGTNWAVNNVNVYRNLQARAPGGGGSGIPMPPDPDSPVVLTRVISYAGGAEAYVSNFTGGPGTNFVGNPPAGLGLNADHYWPVYKDSNEMNAYYGGTNGGPVQNTGIAGWCAQCHDKWHEDGQGGGNKNGEDWNRHPVNNPIVESGSETSGAGITITDFGHYDTAVAVPNKVPAAQDTQPSDYDGTAGNTYYADDSVDRVFCFSCHFVHGGPYYDNLRWDYLQSVATGNQTGNTVGSLVGCQQCHNRGGTFGS